MHRLWVMALALLAVATWLMVVTAGHPWGDDWAGYLLQAHALADGAAASEVATNAVAMRGGDVQIGPDAYPWGFPALLAVVGMASGWDFESLKWIGLVSLLGVVLGTFVLARQLVGSWLAAFAAIVVALRPSVVVDSTYLSSDLPFLAVSALTLALILRYYVGSTFAPRVDAGELIGVVLLSVTAFSVRSNGLVLPATFVFAILLPALTGRCAWRQPLMSSAGFCVLFGIAAALYLGFLPDGSLSHASYVSFDPRMWAQACIRHVNYLAAFPTLDLVRGPAKLLPLAAFVSICVMGAVRRPAEASILGVYIALHLGLITVVPLDGGTRYYYPLLPAAFALFALGLQGVGERIWRNAASTDGLPDGHAAVAVGCGGLALLVIALTWLSLREGSRHADGGPGTPFAADTREAFRYVEANAPLDAQIAFFKPRAFRLATGRLALAISQPSNLARVDWYVYAGNPSERRIQLEERFLADPSSGFALRHSVGNYRIYSR
jgi:hypothetical protein